MSKCFRVIAPLLALLLIPCLFLSVYADGLPSESFHFRLNGLKKWATRGTTTTSAFDFGDTTFINYGVPAHFYEYFDTGYQVNVNPDWYQYSYIRFTSPISPKWSTQAPDVALSNWKVLKLYFAVGMFAFGDGYVPPQIPNWTLRGAAVGGSSIYDGMTWSREAVYFSDADVGGYYDVFTGTLDLSDLPERGLLLYPPQIVLSVGNGNITPEHETVLRFFFSSLSYKFSNDIADLEEKMDEDTSTIVDAIVNGGSTSQDDADQAALKEEIGNLENQEDAAFAAAEGALDTMSVAPADSGVLADLGDIFRVIEDMVNPVVLSTFLIITVKKVLLS